MASWLGKDCWNRKRVMWMEHGRGGKTGTDLTMTDLQCPGRGSLHLGNISKLVHKWHLQEVAGSVHRPLEWLLWSIVDTIHHPEIVFLTQNAERGLLLTDNFPDIQCRESEALRGNMSLLVRGKITFFIEIYRLDIGLNMILESTFQGNSLWARSPLTFCQKVLVRKSDVKFCTTSPLLLYSWWAPEKFQSGKTSTS